MTDTEDTLIIPPAPGDLEITLAEKTSLAFRHDHGMTLTGGFSLSQLRAAVDDHEPFPLVRFKRVVLSK